MKVTPLLAIRRDLAELENRFLTALDSYDGLKEAAEPQVSRWEWANGPVYELDPLFLLDPDIRAGQISSSPPRNPAGWTAYGFTSDDRLVVERQYSDLPTPQYYETFYVQLPDRTLGYRFHYSTPRSVINCSQLVMGMSGPAYFQRWGSRGCVSYTYACTDGRIESLTGMSKEPDEPERLFSGEVRYKDNGVVELWTKEQGQRAAELFYRGRPPAINNPFARRR